MCVQCLMYTRTIASRTFHVHAQLRFRQAWRTRLSTPATWFWYNQPRWEGRRYVTLWAWHRWSHAYGLVGVRWVGFGVAPWPGTGWWSHTWRWAWCGMGDVLGRMMTFPAFYTFIQLYDSWFLILSISTFSEISHFFSNFCISQMLRKCWEKVENMLRFFF